MKKSVIALMIFLCMAFALVLCQKAQASPYLVSDPVAGADYFSLTIDGTVITTTAVASAVHYDLSGIAVGTHTVTGQSCTNLWGCGSASSPFTFSRPSLLAAPGNQRLSQ